MPSPNSSKPPAHEVTLQLRRLAEGDRAALNELFPMVYGELRRIARGQRYRRGSGQTLQTTELLHEAYLRFARRDDQLYNHRQHFYAVAATAMRQILLDAAKSRLRKKRGGGAEHVPLDIDAQVMDGATAVDEQAARMIAIDRGLERLRELAPRAAQVVEYRFFGGLAESEIADLLGVQPRTVRRDWAKARAWLALELDPETTPTEAAATQPDS